MSATKPPAPVMLWESTDPHTVLTRRFGFTDAAHATHWLAAVLARTWGIELISCERLVLSAGNALAWVTTDAGRFVAKWTGDSRLQPRLAALGRLTSWLAGRGLPVCAPRPCRRGQVQVEVDGRSIGVQPVVDGTLLDVSDPEQVHTAGAVLADLHLALASYPEVDRVPASVPVDPDGPTPLHPRITRWLAAKGTDRPRAATDALRDWLTTLRADAALPSQLVHNDFRSANVVWAGSGKNGTGVAAVLDFEEVTYDYRVFDLAKATVLLGTQFRNWGPVPPETQEVFLAGYRATRPLTDAEDAWLRPLLLLHTLETFPAEADLARWGRSVAIPRDGGRLT